MNLTEKIAEISSDVKASKGADLLEMKEDIYYHFTKTKSFEVIRVEATGEQPAMVKALCITTIPDPIFQLVVTHLWKTDLAFDNEWHQFISHDSGTVLQFLTWDDEFISGEIWFDRSLPEEMPNK